MGLGILINGISGSGKSCSVRSLLGSNLKVLVLNCDNKNLPFKTNKVLSDGTVQKSNIVQKTVTTWADLTLLRNKFLASDIDVLVIDTITLALKMFEEQVVKKAANKQTAWGDYQSFLYETVNIVSQTNKTVVFMAHTSTVMVGETAVTQAAIAGGLKNLSLEAFFAFVVSATTKSISELKGEYQNDYLTFTEEELQDDAKGVKHVFQTRSTQDTLNHRIKTGLDYFTKEETYIDNNLLTLINKLKD